MIENALKGGKRYWSWIAFLLVIIAVGGLYWLRQFNEGLTITGLNRDVSWGLYIAQFTFMVGVAASAVMVVLPYYLHNYKAFGKITILGEFVAVGACIMCMGFIFVDMGQPFRITNVFLHPSPNSMMFWDTVVLMGYLVLNVLISFVTLHSEKKSIAPPKWIRPIIILSIPWAVSIHTVTAFLYAGLVARPFWMTAVMAPRFLATAFSAGPALLILLALILRKNTKFDTGKEPIQKLAIIVTYAMIMNVFLLLMEIFTAVYSGIPEHLDHFKYLYFGLGENTALVPWMWTSAVLAVIALVLLIVPQFRKNETLLIWGCIAVFISIWIDKGMGMIVTGYIPNPLHTVTEYVPTFPEVMITLMVWALGGLIITGLYKVALSVRKQLV
ncbi:MAG: NrfD/PsrC family molybdoenzyme membrane anchor subunit [Candidatus Electryonea clarkiae]|nr:NrfD/PsrC family molybdoenzyme membrane anchor subunit [Candidatus Electryonea clarkiae]MDP8288361.1 NrfD/PsrC family molybdoenzyme membrane anchor subunit [Candidatus Electryonea clarkiae]